MSQIQVLVKMRAPEVTHPEYCAPSLEERVRHALLMVDSGHESIQEWAYISRIWELLQGRKGRRAASIRDMIEPVLRKYGYYDTLSVRNG